MRKNKKTMKSMPTNLDNKKLIKIRKSRKCKTNKIMRKNKSSRIKSLKNDYV